MFKGGAELVIVFGASAIADRRDVIPAAIERVGGSIEHFGMPVDPGNLHADRPGRRPPGDRRAWLRALAEGKWLRLDPDADAGGPEGDARGHHRTGRRRPADGDRDAAAAARRAASRTTGTSPRSSWRPASRAGWAGRTSCCRASARQAAGAHRHRTGAWRRRPLLSSSSPATWPTRSRRRSRASM